MSPEEELEDEAYFEAWSREALIALLEVRRQKLVAQAEVKAEVGRLRAERDNAVTRLSSYADIFGAPAEVERLQEEVEYQKRMRREQLHLRDKAEAEVERLRAVEKWAKRVCKPGREYRRDEDIEELRRALEEEK